MFRLNGENNQKAWEEYKGFLEGLGMQFEINGQTRAALKEVEKAFKMGFAMGEASTKGQDLAPVPETKKKPYKRGKLRAPGQVANEGAVILSILEAKGEPMQLMDIVEAAKRKGVNWYPKSASGFMLKIMKVYPEIKKVSTGMYAYSEFDECSFCGEVGKITWRDVDGKKACEKCPEADY